MKGGELHSSRCFEVATSGERLGAGQEAEPSCPLLCQISPSLPLRDIQGVWVEGKKEKKRKSKDIKIDPAVTGDKGCLGMSLLPDSEPSFQTETFQAKYQLPGDQPRSWWPL